MNEHGERGLDWLFSDPEDDWRAKRYGRLAVKLPLLAALLALAAIAMEAGPMGYMR